MAPPGPWDKELWGQRVEKTLSPSMETKVDRTANEAAFKFSSSFRPRC